MTGDDRLELTVRRTRLDYFWGLLFDGLNNRLLQLALLIPLVAEGLRAFQQTEGDSFAMRALGIAARLGIVASAIIVVIVALFAFSAAMAWRAPGYLGPIAYAFSSAGVWGRTEATTTETAWIAYRVAFETRSLLILRQKAGLVQIIPKRDLSAQTVDALRRLLREHLGRRAQVQEVKA